VEAALISLYRSAEISTIANGHIGCVLHATKRLRDFEAIKHLKQSDPITVV
jgi:hypothetical protein